MLSEVDILNRLESGDLKITPFEKSCLTGVGYDLRLGKFGYSLKTYKKFDIEKDKGICIGPQETVVVMAMEEISIPNNLAGTFHSQVKRMHIGLQAISTTADPAWEGTPLIHITNNLKTQVWLSYEDTLCTICFYELKTPSNIVCREPQNKRIALYDLDGIAQRYSEKRENSLKNKLLSKRFLLICAIILNIVIIVIAKTATASTNEDIAIIISIMTLMSMFIIEIVKKD
jgi:deoxycytidine triphosphate deaminase